MSAPDLRTIADVAPLLRSRQLSPVALTRQCLDAIAARPSLNAFISVLERDAMDEARRHEAEIAGGRYRGPLHGIPIAVKELLDVAGTRTTSGSAVPVTEAASDTPVVRRLRDAGAVIVGKTNLHEFAFGTTSEDSAFGPVRNPLDESRSPGGSSGGSAAALVAGMCFGAIGTDTGGSIRIPAAACGIVGLKPTLGEISCDGVVPLSTTLDHVGPMTRSVADAAMMFGVLIDGGLPPVERATGRLVFGIPRPYFCDRVDAGVARAIEAAREALLAAGHEVVDVRIDAAEITPDVYLHIVLPEAVPFHAPLLERHADKYVPAVRLRLEMGRYVLGEDYVRAMRLRNNLKASVDRALDGCDVLLAPALAIPAPVIGVPTVQVAGRTEPIRAAMLRLTQLFNITGHPALALPGRPGDDGLPRGLQIVARHGATRRLLEIGLAVELQISGGAGSVGGGTG